MTTPEPTGEAGSGDTANDSDSEGEGGVEESKSAGPTANSPPPAVEPAPMEPETDPPAAEPDWVAGDQDSPAEDPSEPDEHAGEAAAARTARRQLATHIKGPEDDAPRRYDRTRAQTR